MLLIFNILPLVLVALYPFPFFQKSLNYCCASCIKYKLSLQIFMDAFHGCYKVDTLHDYRHFATLYLTLRFFIYAVFDFTLYFTMASIPLVFTSVLIAKFQPYKDKQCNTTDMIMILALFIGYTIQSLKIAYPKSMFQKSVEIVAIGIVTLIPVSIMSFLALIKILSECKKCLKTTSAVIKKRMEIKVNSNGEQYAILNHHGSNYHTV